MENLWNENRVFFCDWIGGKCSLFLYVLWLNIKNNLDQEQVITKKVWNEFRFCLEFRKEKIVFFALFFLLFSEPIFIFPSGLIDEHLMISVARSGLRLRWWWWSAIEQQFNRSGAGSAWFRGSRFSPGFSLWLNGNSIAVLKHFFWISYFLKELVLELIQLNRISSVFNVQNGREKQSFFVVSQRVGQQQVKIMPIHPFKYRIGTQASGHSPPTTTMTTATTTSSSLSTATTDSSNVTPMRTFKPPFHSYDSFDTLKKEVERPKNTSTATYGMIVGKGRISGFKETSNRDRGASKESAYSWGDQTSNAYVSSTATTDTSDKRGQSSRRSSQGKSYKKPGLKCK